MLRYLSLDIICSSKLTVFLELRSRKTVRFSEQIMSADKYLSIFSRQMEIIVYISNKRERNNPLLKTIKKYCQICSFRFARTTRRQLMSQEEPHVSCTACPTSGSKYAITIIQLRIFPSSMQDVCPMNLV